MGENFHNIDGQEAGPGYKHDRSDSEAKNHRHAFLFNASFHLINAHVEFFGWGCERLSKSSDCDLLNIYLIHCYPVYAVFFVIDMRKLSPLRPSDPVVVSVTGGIQLQHGAVNQGNFSLYAYLLMGVLRG
ncbi:hypothetical protein ElyMa_005929200 [Elysia marginata]|uniref:Uncharacterized protein n=1 Tax=Elysia marginata TaxID=1093978 RepID=A0AAV4G8H6_9GAST|nr:hypothetical protein ElyMa_005929200 [Elysia marginata]